MQFLYDFFPILLFFIAYKLKGIFVATAVLIIASAIQIAYTFFKKRKVEPLHLFTFVLILIFGGLTLWLHDADFLKWKVSIVNWLFAVLFLISTLTSKPLIQRILEPNIALPEKAWQRLNMAWASFFFALGILNYLVMTHFSTDVWVDFKVFGLFGLTLIFIIGQGIYLYRHLKNKEP